MSPWHSDTTIEENIRDIIEKRMVQVCFQPIIQVSGPSIYGYEALVRGPSDSWLHSPVVLLEAAANAQLLVQLEQVILQEILREYREQNLPGKLFLNVTTDTMLHLQGASTQVTEYLQDLGLDTSRLVVEITETRPCFDTEKLEDAVHALQATGIQVAIDDLGEGFASLKRWSIMRPAFVKIDRHFIDGIYKDPLKQQFIKSVLDIAKVSGAQVIAEGVEQSADLQVIISAGIELIQGYIIARPESHPRLHLGAEVVTMLKAKKTSKQNKTSSLRTNYCAGDISSPGPTVLADTSLSKVLALFQADHDLCSLPVIDQQGYPLGIIRSLDFLSMASKPFFHEVYGKKECSELMDTKSLLFDHKTDVRAMSEIVSSMNDRHLIDGFIVTTQGRYHASGKMTDLIKAVSEMQVFAARYANPLTFLPGNVPIDEELQGLLDQKAGFTVAYWDLNDFKPYNDVYGYGEGDRVIRYTAEVLEQTLNSDRDFLGHVGGDDFVVIYQSLQWEEMARATIDTFDKGIRSFMKPEHIKAGGYVSTNRKGEAVFHPVVSLSAGLLQVSPGMFTYPSEIAQAVSGLKKLAKRKQGSNLFIDRRSKA